MSPSRRNGGANGVCGSVFERSSARHRGDALAGAMASGDVDVIGAGVLEREADELAAPLQARPVEEFVGHRALGSGSDQRAHPVRRFQEAAGVGDELAVAGMVGRFDALDLALQRGCAFSICFMSSCFSLPGPTTRIAPASAIDFVTSSRNA